MNSANQFIPCCFSELFRIHSPYHYAPFLHKNLLLNSKNHELQILAENLLQSQKSHSKSEIASSCKSFEFLSETNTEADSHHKETNRETDTTIQLSNNEQSKGDKCKRQSKAKRNLCLCKTRECNKTPTRKTARVCKWLHAKPAATKENCIQ